MLFSTRLASNAGISSCVQPAFAACHSNGQTKQDTELSALWCLLQLQSTGSLAPGTIGKILSGRGVKRGDDISSGGRLSRRNADPIAEAERKAQQDKLYSLDLDRVLAGQ